MDLEDDFAEPLRESPDDAKRFHRPSGAHKTRRRNPDEVKVRAGRSRAQRRADKREKRIPYNRICPSCGDLVLDSKKWVVKLWTLTERIVVCRKCSFKREYRSKQSDMTRRYAHRKRRAELRARRAKLIAPLLPADRICPLCERLVLIPNKWSRKRGRIACESCNTK